jgi:uncharacterized protein YlxP (DUF503 family)
MPRTHQRAVVGFSLVGNDKALINSKIDKMFNLAEELGLAEVIDSEMELSRMTSLPDRES